MASTIAQKITELNDKLQELSAQSQSSAGNIQQVTDFLTKLSSGQIISNLGYLAQGLREVSLAMKTLGAEDSEIREATSSLLNLSLASRTFAKERAVLSGGVGKSLDITSPAYQQNINTIYRQIAAMRVQAQTGQQGDFYQNYAEFQRILSGYGGKIGFARPQNAPPLSPMQAGYEQTSTNAPTVVSKESIQMLGLGSREADNLNKRLRELGFTTANFSKVTEEASSGIKTVRIEAEQGANGIRTYTAHIDRAGNVLDDTQKRFRTFGDAIVRDIVEVTKWTIAIGLVYGPMRKMQELLAESRKLQSDLVDTQITLGRTTTQLGQIFSNAAAIADETSSSIGGVIEGYNEALAATGGMENQAKRLVTTETLLKDSMILSKLAGIEQAQALDTLVGALRQAGLSLDQGYKLLDGWVAVSKKANVSLNQMASTFAIVGTAAQDVGMSFNELNALTGTLAEASKLSADETGNAIRGFISGFQSAKAEQILARYGIAVRNLEGDIRSFTDIMRELAVLKQEGVLSDKDVAAISNVVGGGFRRGAQFATVLQNWPRFLQLVEVSENAAGDATEALELKTATLESAVTRLNNAFSKLAMSLGTEGGTLGGMTLLTEGTTKLVNVVKTLVDVLGAAAPLMAVLGMGKLAAGTGTGQRMLAGGIPNWLAFGMINKQDFSTRMGMRTTEVGSGGMMRNVSWGNFLGQATEKLSNAIGRGLGKIPLFGTRTNLGNVGLGGAAGSVIMAGTQALQGNYEKAGASILGSFVGGMVGGGAGAIIGGAIAQGFYDTFLSVAPGIAQRWAELIAEAQKDADSGGEGGTEPKDINELDKEIVDGLNIFERLNVNLLELVSKGANLINPERATKLEEQDVLTMFYKLQKEGATGGIEGRLTTNMYGQPVLSQATMRRMAELEDMFFLQRAETMIELTTAEGGLVEATKEISDLSAKAAADMVEEAIKDIAENKPGAVATYQTAGTIQNALTLSAAKLVQSTEQIQGQGYDIPQIGAEEAVQIVSTASEEQLVVLTQAIDNLIVKREQLRILTERGIISKEDVERAESLSDEIDATAKGLENLLPAIQQSTLITEAQTKLLPTVEIPEEVPQEQIPTILENARKFWMDYLEKSGLTDAEIQAWVAIQQEKILKYSGQILDIKTNVPDEFITQAKEAAGFGGKQSQWSFTDLRDKLGGANQPSFEQMFTKYAQYAAAFKANVPGFELELSPVTFLLKEGFKTLDIDMRLFNLAMQDLIDIEKEKNLEGMFNLPSGSTFYVPFDAAALDARSRASGGSSIAPSWADQYAPDPEALAGEAKKQLDVTTTMTRMDEERAEAMQRFAERQKYIESQLPTKPDYSDIVIEDIRAKRAELSNPTPAKPGMGTLVPATPAGVGIIQAIVSALTQGQGFQDWFSRVSKNRIDQGQQGSGFWETIKGGDESILKSIQNWWQGITGENAQTGVTAPAVADTTGLSAELNKLTNTLSKGGMSTTLQLDINAQTSLMVDGRVLAMIIKPYLYEDLLRFEGSAGSVARVVTIS